MNGVTKNDPKVKTPSPFLALKGMKAPPEAGSEGGSSLGLGKEGIA
jgi:hypothetical protein